MGIFSRKAPVPSAGETRSNLAKAKHDQQEGGEKAIEHRMHLAKNTPFRECLPPSSLPGGAAAWGLTCNFRAKENGSADFRTRTDFADDTTIQNWGEVQVTVLRCPSSLPTVQISHKASGTPLVIIDPITFTLTYPTTRIYGMKPMYPKQKSADNFKHPDFACYRWADFTTDGRGNKTNLSYHDGGRDKNNYKHKTLAYKARRLPGYATHEVRSAKSNQLAAVLRGNPDDPSGSWLVQLSPEIDVVDPLMMLVYAICLEIDYARLRVANKAAKAFNNHMENNDYFIPTD